MRQIQETVFKIFCLDWFKRKEGHKTNPNTGNEMKYLNTFEAEPNQFF